MYVGYIYTREAACVSLKQFRLKQSKRCTDIYKNVEQQRG